MNPTFQITTVSSQVHKSLLKARHKTALQSSNQWSILQNQVSFLNTKLLRKIWQMMSCNHISLLLTSFVLYQFLRIWRWLMMKILKMHIGWFQALFQNLIGTSTWALNLTLQNSNFTLTKPWGCLFHKEKLNTSSVHSETTKNLCYMLVCHLINLLTWLLIITLLPKSCWYAWHIPIRFKSTTTPFKTLSFRQIHWKFLARFLLQLNCLKSSSRST